MIKKIFTSISFFLFIFSFTAPATISLWKEFHQSAAAILACFLLSVSTIDNKKTYLSIYTKTILFIILVIIFFYKIKNPAYISPTIVGVIYLSCTILMHNAAISLGKKTSIITATATLFVICFFSIFLQTIQLTGFSYKFYPWVYQMDPSPGMRPYANIGQPNILSTTYVTFFCFLVWLFKEKTINKTAFYLSTIIIAYGIALTQSRTAYLSIITIAVIIFLDKKTRLVTKLASPSLLIFTFTIAKIVEEYHGIGREITNNLNNGRFDIWLMGLDAIKNSPLTGYGFHETARATISVIEQSGYKYSFTAQIHNLFLDIIIWFGIPIGCIIILLIINTACQTIKNCIKIENLFPAIILIPFFIHSLLEYPLYYANNLMLFGFLLGINSLYIYEKKTKKLH